MPRTRRALERMSEREEGGGAKGWCRTVGDKNMSKVCIYPPRVSSDIPRPSQPLEDAWNLSLCNACMHAPLALGCCTIWDIISHFLALASDRVIPLWHWIQWTVAKLEPWNPRSRARVLSVCVFFYVSHFSRMRAEKFSEAFFFTFEPDRRSRSSRQNPLFKSLDEIQD